MKIKSLDQNKDWRGKKVLLRVDFNLPIKNGKLGEDFRISSALPSINFLIKKGAALIIVTHWGDPKKEDKSLSTRKLANRLRQLSKLKIKFIPDLVGAKAIKASANLKAGEIIFLENLRFHDGEKKNDKKFAQSLAALADVYVNEAFSVCHREQASVAAVSACLPTFAGIQLVAEINNLQKIFTAIKPLVVVMGGSKISTKAPLIKKLYNRSNKILIGGALANTFFKEQGQEIGRSLFDRDSKKEVGAFLKNKKLEKKIILPLDVVIKDKGGKSRYCLVEDVKKSDVILDIGPATIALFSLYLKKAQTIVWNGPLGKFEETPYRHGTLAIATIIAARSTGKAFGLVGGGETIAALKLTKMESHVDWISTAGGAMLAYLGGEKLPGLKNIIS
jgi:3-phosphoglycerate kinase